MSKMQEILYYIKSFFTNMKVISVIMGTFLVGLLYISCYLTESISEKKTESVGKAGIVISSFEVNSVDDGLQLKAYVKSEAKSIKYRFSYRKKDNNELEVIVQDFAESSSCLVSNDDLQKGTYEFILFAKDENDKTDRKTSTYEVKGGGSKDEENCFVLYYKGMDNPHLMYQLDGGLWSKTPGEAFEKKEEQKGFPYKIVIDMEKASKIKFAINDGKSKEDTNNGLGYEAKKGKYTFSDGKLTDLNADKDKTDTSDNSNASVDNNSNKNDNNKNDNNSNNKNNNSNNNNNNGNNNSNNNGNNGNKNNNNYNDDYYDDYYDGYDLYDIYEYYKDIYGNSGRSPKKPDGPNRHPVGPHIR